MATLAPPSPRRLAVAPPPSRPTRMGEAEYDRWSLTQELVEWVDGRVIQKMPENTLHDVLRNWLMVVLGLFVRGRRLGQVYGPELTMRLPQGPTRRCPDVLFVSSANAGRVGATMVDGPADLIIEVVSPDSVGRDYREKFLEYEAAGVPEYWIADPLSERLEPYRLGGDGAYELIPPNADGRVHSTAVPGFSLRPADLFADDRPEELALLAELGVP